MIEQKPTRRELALQIAALTNEGLSVVQIAARMKIRRERIIRIAAQFHVRLHPRGGARRLSAQLNAKRFEAIQALAAEANVSVGTMLARIASVVIDEGLPVAKRRLGRLARPKRHYQWRERV